MTNETAIEYAKAYLDLGFQIIPIHHPLKTESGFVCSCRREDCNSPAKHPVARLAPNGSKSATSDPELVKQWFGNGAWNVGIVTGSESNLIIVDIDPRHSGDETIAGLERTHGPLPRTIQFLTGGGGCHVLFRHPGGNVPNSAGKIGKGVDIRGEGGYVVAPPSQHITGRPYAISVDHHPAEIGLACPPFWLFDVIRADKEAGSPNQEWRNLIGDPIPEGSRNDSLTRISGHLLAHGIDPHLCLDLMIALKATQCKPALPESEVIDIVASITNREMAKRDTRRVGGIICG